MTRIIFVEKFKFYANSENQEEQNSIGNVLEIVNSKTTNEILAMILIKLNNIEQTNKETADRMIEKYTFLEKEMVKLEVLVKKSLRSKIPDRPTSKILIEPNETVTKSVQEEFKTTMEIVPSTSQKQHFDESLMIQDDFETNESSEVYQEIELEQYEFTDHPKKLEEDFIFMVKKKRTDYSKKRMDLESLKMIPVETEEDLAYLDNLLEINDEECKGFVEYLRNVKFSTSLKNAFTEIISEGLLLNFNYSGKGQTKRALNAYGIFSHFMFGKKVQ